MINKYRWWFATVITLLVLSAASGDAVAAEEWQQPVIELKRVEKPPVIDGDLSDGVWAATPAVGFRQFPRGTPPQQATTARIATDGTWLFAAFDVKDNTPEPEPAEPLRFRPDSPVSSDHVELFVDPGTEGKKYFHFLVDRFGQQRDGTGSRPFGSKQRVGSARTRAFTGHWRSAGRLVPGGWTVEVAIPLFYFEREGGDKSKWGVNFARLETNPREWTCWSLTERSFHEPERLGRLAGVPAQTARAPFAPVLAGVWAGVMSMVTREWVYPVNVVLRNDSDRQAGTVQLMIEDMVYQKGRQRFDQEVALKAGEKEHLYTKDMANLGEVLPDPVGMVSIQDELGVWRQGLGNMEGMIVRGPLDAYLNLSYYTTEDRARLHYHVDQPKEVLATHRLSVKMQDGEGQALREETVAAIPEQGGFLELPIANLPVGSYPVRVELLDAGQKEVDVTVLNLRRLAPLAKGNEVKVDHYNRCVLVNGKPFFPYGVCRLTGDLQTIKNLGFNTVWRWGGHFASAQNPDISPQQAAREESMLREAERIGLMVVERLMLTRWWSQWKHNENMATTVAEWTKKDVPEVIGVIQGHPGLLGYMGFDEPGEMNIYPGPRLYSEICADTMQAFHQNDPYHPAFHNYGTNVPSEAKWKVGQDLYQIYHGSVRGRAMAEIDARNNQIAAQDHKPLGVMLWQGGGAAGQWSPTIERARVYTALVHGATGIYFWTWPAIHVDTHRVMAEMAKEIAALSPALLRRRPEQKVTYEGIDPKQAAVDLSLATMPNGTPVLLMVNKEDYAVDLTITLPWLPAGGGVKEFFQGKKLAVKNKAFTLRLEGIGTRAFALAGCRLQDLDQEHEIRVKEAHLTEVRALPKKEVRASKNEVINSSFEFASQLRAWPEGWQPSQYGDFLPREQFNPEEMRLIGTPKSPWGQDTENPYHGRYSLRMEPEARFAGTPYWSNPSFLRVETGKPYVFSLYMRANRDGQAMQVRVTGIGEKRFELTQMWQRYVITGTCQPDETRSRVGYTQIQIAFPSHSGGAIVWLDALQLEEGTEPTAYEQDGYLVLPGPK